MKNLFLLLAVSLLYTTNLKAKNWKLIGNEDNIQIYTLEAKDGVLPFKAIGVIKSDLSKVLNTLKDHEKKPQWAPKLEKVTLHQMAQNQSEYIFSEYYKTPWPASDREFLLKGQIVQIDNKTVILKAHSVNQEKEYSPYLSKNHVQAEVKYINVKLSSIGPQQTQIEFAFHGDMKGFMPVWLMNLIQKKWPLRFIQGLKAQTEKPVIIGQIAR